jgi:hypothetical protein
VFGLLLGRAHGRWLFVVTGLGKMAEQGSVFVENEDRAVLKHGNVSSRGDHALSWTGPDRDEVRAGGSWQAE